MAQITVYAALSLGLVLSLLCTCVQSVKFAVADAEINMSARLSAEAVFAGYNNKLLDEFCVFAISDEQCCNEKLAYYAQQNAEMSALANQFTYTGSSVSEKGYMTDDGGYGLSKQVTEYMRAGGFAGIVKDFLDIDEQTKKTEKINEVTAKVEAVSDELIELDEIDKKLIRVVRSISTESRSGLIEDICEDIKMYEACMSAEDTIGADDYERAYEKNKEVLLSYLEDTLAKCREALELIDEYDDKDSDVDTMLSECRSLISASASELGDISQTMQTDVDDIAVSKTTDREKKINKKRIRPILEKNIELCESMIDDLNGLDGLSLYSATWYESEYASLARELSELNITGLLSECANVDIDSKGTGTGTLKNIRSLIENGISGIVLKGLDVKEGKITHSGLAGEYQSSGSAVSSGSGSDFNGVAGEIVDTALFNAYVFDKFPSYTDVHGDDSNGEYDGWSELNYVIEYIIAGNDTDVSNLNEVILKLSAVREAANFTFIITDSAKRRESLALATTMLGASGNAAAIKAAQYVIMASWAYGESVVDVRRLLKGEGLALVKTSSEWRLSLENLMKLEFDTDSESSSSGSAGKYSYEDYLGLLLYMMDQTTKNYRTMQAMELRIINLGQENFRMKTHAYKAVCKVTATIDYGGRNVERSITYSYADG